MSIPTEALSMDVLEQVLSRLGLADRPAPTPDRAAHALRGMEPTTSGPIWVR
jgi:hypothetical protein